MHRSLSLVGLFGFACLSLLSLVAPAEAFGRCRHRQQCACVAPCVPATCCQPGSISQGFQPWAGTQTKCLACINGTWQTGDPCVWVDASLEGHGCLQEPEPPPGASGKGRVHYSGCGLHYSLCRGCWVWYSDQWSMHYCDTSHEWNCHKRFRAKLAGICSNGMLCWDIYVDN